MLKLAHKEHKLLIYKTDIYRGRKENKDSPSTVYCNARTSV